MKSLHIRGVPETIIERLKRRAARHHRSLQGELLAMLEAVAKETATGPSPAFEIKTVRTAGNQNWSREAIYED